MPVARMRDEWWFVVGVVSGGHFLSHFYILTFPPLFPLLQAEFGLNNTQLGLLVSVISIATLLQTVVGEAVDRVGAKRIFVLGIVVTSGGIMLVGLAESYLMLLAFAILSGLGQSTFHPSDYSLLDTATDESNQGKSFSVHTFGGYAGFAAAPIVVGTLGVTYGWQTALLVVGAFGLIYAAFAALALDPIHRRQLDDLDRAAVDDSSVRLRDSLTALMKPPILVMFAFFVIYTMGSTGIHTFTAILMVNQYGFTETIGNTALTGFLSVASIGVLLGGVFADRYAPRRIIVTSLSAAAVLMWVTISGLVPIGAITAIVLFSAMGFCTGLVLPSRDRLVNAFSAAGSTGKSFGFVFTGISVGGLISPVLLGAVIDVTHVVMAFALVGVFYLVAAVIAVITSTEVVAPTTQPAEST